MSIASPPPIPEPYKPNPGPQTMAFASKADIMFFGGSAGGSKTNYLVVQPLAHVHLPDFKAVIFRRLGPQITQPGGLWNETEKWYPRAGGEPLQSPYRWNFPSGAQLALRSIQYEADKKQFQGGQFAYIGFDEITHFEESVFWYLLSRNRTSCGIQPYVRCTCNPEAGHWVASLLEWWIDQETGYPIPERAGVLRWFYRIEDEMHWYDSREEAEEAHPEMANIARPKSITFIPAAVTDNPKLLEKDPDYMASLLALPKIERFRLLEGNWKISVDSMIELGWIRKFRVDEEGVCHWEFGGVKHHGAKFDRYAVIDTAGTGKQKMEEAKGKPPSYTCAGIFDYHSASDVTLWRDTWRERVGWSDLISKFVEFLIKWKVHKVVIENAHFGQALQEELRKRKFKVVMIGPVIDGMDGNRGAKLERAVASGFLTSLEFGKLLFSPNPDEWPKDFTNLLIGWKGLDDEVADLCDVGSYAVHIRKKMKRKGMRVR
jgi:hypothetical protein